MSWPKNASSPKAWAGRASWLRDESLEDTADLPPPEVLAAEIVEDLQAALEQFREIAEDLGE
jgi:type I restriction enzyme M protein